MSVFKKITYFFCPWYNPNKSITVRYAFPMFFTFAAFLGAVALLSSSKTYVHLESSVQSLHAGESFQIMVYVSASVPVNAVDISLSFPKEQIVVTGIDTGESVITLWTEEPKVENNKVLLSGGTFRRGFVGNHLIATINAKAIETGLAKFNVEDVLLLAGDGTGSKVAVAKTGDEVATLFISKDDGLPTSKQPDAIGIKSVATIVIITDIDGDGNVSLADISRFMSAWGTQSTIYDFNGDGEMSFRDFGIILADSFSR